jgi:hypothetical protein
MTRRLLPGLVLLFAMNIPVSADIPATNVPATNQPAVVAPPPAPSPWPTDEVQGFYFAKKQYVEEPLPTFDASKDLLPVPIIDGRPELVDMYWKCWQLAFEHLRQPKPGSGMVSNYLDAAFNGNIFSGTPSS